MTSEMKFGMGIMGFFFLLLMGFFAWLGCPVVSLAYPGSALFWAVLILGLFWIYSVATEKVEVGATVTALFIILYFGYAFINSPMCRANAYYNQLGEPTQKEFTQDLAPIDVNQLPIVDGKLAAVVGEKRLGEEKALGSQFQAGEYTMQNVNGQLVLVAPLEHRGFFTWMDNKAGAPGYIKVSASNPQDVKLVQEINGQKIKIRFQESAFFGDFLDRYIWSNGYATRGITDKSFELDDNGFPYYVVTLYENTIGWGGSEATGVLVVNACTGEIQEYSIDNAPAWVDRIQPKEFVVSQVANYGEYVKGFINLSDDGRLKIGDSSGEYNKNVTEERDKLISIDGTAMVYSNGRCYYYLGMTSVGKDEATNGFQLIDSRTKQVSYYHMGGALESAAMRSAQGKLRDFGFKACQPFPINLDGVPTYFMTLKDGSGLIKRYAMVNIRDFGLVGVGETIEETKANYKAVLYSSGNSQALSQTATMKNTEGVVSRLSSTVIGGNTFYYMLVNSLPDQVLVGKADISVELPLTCVGDKVKVFYIDASNFQVDIRTFDNLNVNLKKSVEQTQTEAKAQEVQKNVDVGVTEASKTDKALQGLSEKEKAELLKQLEEQKK